MAGRLSKLTQTGRALVRLPDTGRQLARRIPEPVQIGLGRVRRRSLIIALEVFGGLVVIGAVALALLYGRLSQGPISLTALVPTLEESINRELADLNVRIDDFIAQRSPSGPGISLRLRNVRLIDTQGAVVARAPSAAIGLSGKALLRGQIAPGSVDFIGPRLLLFYSAETGLSLTFSRGTPDPSQPPQGQTPQPRASTGTGAPGAAETAPGADPRPEPGIALIAPSREINLTRTLSAAFQRARRGRTASAFLTRFGVRDAVVIFDQEGSQSVWQVPDFSINLQHKEKRSIILGTANISSATGPWRLSFRTEQSEKQQALTFSALIQDLIPNSIAAKFPGIPALQALKLPVTAETSIQMSTAGELMGAEAKIQIAAGHIVAPWDHKRPMLIDEGALHLRYQADSSRVEILPSTLQWGESRATLSGVFAPNAVDTQNRHWNFRLSASDAVLAADEFGLPPVAVERWEAEGTYEPTARHMRLDRFVMQVEKGSLQLAGTVVDAPGSPEVKLAGLISPMPVATLKQIWPKFLAGGAREWVGERVAGGHISGGNVRVDMPAGLLAQLEQGGDIPDAALSFETDATSLEIHYIPGLPPLQTGDAKLTIQGRRFGMAVPEAWITTPTGKRIALTKGSFAIDDLRPDPQTGVINFHMHGDAQAVLELLDHKPLEYLKEIGMKPDDIQGRSQGDFRVALPLLKDVEFSDITLKGIADVNELRATGAFDEVGVEGGAVTLNVTEKALEARGDILLRGVPALVTWQRIFGAPVDKQPELRVTMILDEATRTQLGLNVNHVVRGPVPVILGVAHDEAGKKKYRVRADLGNADIILSSMGWRKPPGRSAILTFDVGAGPQGNRELQNLRVEGDELGIQGWIALGPDDKPKAFYFPDFSFNVITRVEIAGELGEDGIWDVQAHGSAYDGRQFFQSLFSAGKLVEDQPAPPDRDGGVNLTAKIGAVVGFFNTTVSDVSISLQKRNGALTALDVAGRFDGSAPIAVRLVRQDGQPRLLLAESEDAGAAFRLIGFYPRVEGGQASLQVNLDAEGPANEAGILWARNFAVVGDRVVSEVVATGHEDPTHNFGDQQMRLAKAERQRIPFDQLRVPFSVGGGRFELHDSYINGPQLGATLRGVVDFNGDQIDLGGTYIPAYGLNSALGSIPVIGNLLVGRRGEGVLGITFAIKGPTSDPNVMVNPMSVVAPGIFRQIFEYTGRSPESFPPPRPSMPARQAVQEPRPPAYDPSAQP